MVYLGAEASMTGIHWLVPRPHRGCGDHCRFARGASTAKVSQHIQEH